MFIGFVSLFLPWKNPKPKNPAPGFSKEQNILSLGKF